MDPSHGTRSTYRLGCRCASCRAASAHSRHLYRRQIVRHVDASPVRRHLTSLTVAGVGVRQLAALAVVAERTVRDTLHGTRTRLLASTAGRLLALRPILAPGQVVESSDAAALLRALLDEGYTRSQMARGLGIDDSSLRRILTAPTPRMRVRVALRTHALAEALLGNEADAW